MTFRLWSNDFADGDRLPLEQVLNGFGHAGGNVSPHLAWEGAPAGTQSFVLTLYDPDAPSGSGWWHWIVANIPARVESLPKGVGSGTTALPEGALQTRTDFGGPGYGGAAPPPGPSHRYIFRVQALGTADLGVDAGASGAMVGMFSGMHRLAEATLTAHYP